MAIEDRNLSAGTKLTAKYKGETYTAEVVEEEGGLRYRLADGRTFKSPSSAGKAVLGERKSCNGWAFWSLERGEPSSTPASQAPDAQPTHRTGEPSPKPEPTAKRGRKAKAAPSTDQTAEDLDTTNAPSTEEAPAETDPESDEGVRYEVLGVGTFATQAEAVAALSA